MARSQQPSDHTAPDAFAGLTKRRRERGLPVGTAQMPRTAWQSDSSWANGDGEFTCQSCGAELQDGLLCQECGHLQEGEWV